MFSSIILITLFHIYLTILLLDACNKQHGKGFTKKHKILLLVPILNYIFVIRKEIINHYKLYR
jgi:hypothetical protein